MVDVWYHATPASNLPVIKVSGLGGRAGRGTSGLRASSRRRKTYLFQDFDDAVDFAAQVSDQVKGSPTDWAILKVQIPSGSRVLPDPEFGLEIGEGGPGYTTSTIPPENLRVVRLFSTKEETKRVRQARESHPETPYWAFGSRGGEWIPAWTMGPESIDTQIQTLERFTGRFTGAMVSDTDRRTLNFLRRLREGEVSEEEKAHLVESAEPPGELPG